MSYYLLHRPIAVLISTIALIVFGIIAWARLPISLIPTSEVPRLKITIYYPDNSPNVIEEEVLSVIRGSLLTVQGFRDIQSTAYYESGIINLDFEPRTRMSLAYLEVNEIIDRIIDKLPDDLDRPIVSKVSSSDIPIILVNLIPDNSDALPDLTQLTENVIKKRFEQVEGISIVDINGARYPEIIIVPNQVKLSAYQITIQDIEQSLENSNRNIGGLTIKDGQYQYYLRLKNTLNGIDDIKGLALQSKDGSILLSEVAEVQIKVQKTSGYYEVNGRPAIAIEIYKQEQARLTSVMEELKTTLDQLKKDYPTIDIITSRNQFSLLQTGISNLSKSLLFGGVFAFLILFVFMGNYRLPMIMGLTIPITVVISILLFQLAGLSINIMTLSGLALGVGMLIDNSIIMLDNISRRHHESGNKKESCVNGAREVAGPMISSVLTTLAVFVPVVFLGGVAGALFYDQAVSIAIVLGVSLMVSFILLPVIYNLIIRESGQYDSAIFTMIMGVYKKGYHFVTKHRLTCGILFILMIPLAIYLGKGSRLEGIPDLKEKNLLLRLEWDEPISQEENLRRTRGIVENANKKAALTETVVGLTQFTFNSENKSLQNAEIYMEFSSDKEKTEASKLLDSYVDFNYPNISYSIGSLENPISQLLKNDKPFWQIRWRLNKVVDDFDMGEVIGSFPLKSFTIGSELQRQPYYEVGLKQVKAQSFQMELSSIYKAIENAFKNQEMMSFDDGINVIPVSRGSNNLGIYDILKNTFVSNKNGVNYPLSEFIEVRLKEDYKEIRSNQSGPYYSFHTDYIPEDPSMEEIYNWSSENNLQTDFSGSFIEDKAILKQLTLILVISGLLLYFILAAQFESFIQPLIIITSLPIGVFGALLLLQLTGNSLNIMSVIGIIIMLGIMVNDTILKVDTINRRYFKDRKDLNVSLRESGKVRLKPILMTTLTTILALVPILFSEGIGSELQKPLLIGVIGGLFMGTITSLYYVPISYEWFTGKRR